jgi:hypothetical protein
MARKEEMNAIPMLMVREKKSSIHNNIEEWKRFKERLNKMENCLVSVKLKIKAKMSLK